MLNKVHKIISTSVGILLIGLILLVFVLRMDLAGSVYNEDPVDYSEGWMDENGKEATVFGIVSPTDGKVTLHRALDGSQLNGESLCFISHSILFDIYIDDELIYDFHPALGGYYGKYYGDYIHTVALPSFSDERTLSIQGTILTENEWTGFEEIVLQNSRSYTSEIVQANMWKFVICLLTFGFGVMLFAFGLIENILRGDTLETVYLGVITMLLSLWANASTKILQIVTGNSALLRLMDYTVLCLLPIPILIFVASFTKSRKNKLLNICIGLCLLNFTCQAIGVPLGLFDYSDMLRFDHLMIIIGLLLIAYLIVKAIREKNIDRSQCTYLISALAVISCAGIVDMIRYYAGRFPDSPFVTRIGLIVFVGILAVYEFRQFITVRMKSREAEVMQRLAMEDTLTGLRNRTAFTYYEKELLSRQKGKYLFIHLDVNYLKKVNDTYGHAEGDRHIKAAAHAIKESFGEYGQCFRIGGDEFFVIMDGKNYEAYYKNAVKVFKTLQSAYNAEEKPPVPLSIAHGTAEYDCVTCDPEEAIRLADSRMYEDKKKIKAESAV